MEIKKVGIIGCGIMGSGIAQTCAQAGYNVIVMEINNTTLENGLAEIDHRLQKSADKGKLTHQNKADILSLIKGTINILELCDRDLIIEAVPEILEVKQKVFIELDNICPQDAILATNCSTLSVIDIATVTKRPQKVLGMHFFNPVTAMRLLEIVKTIITSKETIEIGKIFGESIGKTVVIAPDVPGFLVNRLNSPLGILTIKMLEDGIATRDDIDTAIKLGTNAPMGRFELMDLIGLDTLLEGYENLYKEYQDPLYIPPLLLKKMVSMGWLGKKSGKGFYEYDKDGNKVG